MKIIKTSEALPKSGRYVLAWLEGAKIPMRAMWAAQHTLPLGDDADPEWGEYSEEKDEYFCPAGWYEMNQHEEQHWGVDGNVVAWCELPRLDHQCLAQIEEPAQPVAEICSASHDDAQFGERAIKPLRDISGFEYGTPLYAGAAPAAVAPLPAVLEQIAQGWDGCMYDAPGETLDIGADIRAAATQALADLERAAGNIASAVALRAALETPAAPAVPAGFALVPIEPTQQMLDAGRWSGAGSVSIQEEWARKEVWSRMLATVTPPPAAYADDLVALVTELVQALRKATPDNDLAGHALDYLKRNGLQESPLRAADTAPQAPAAPDELAARLRKAAATLAVRHSSYSNISIAWPDEKLLKSAEGRYHQALVDLDALISAIPTETKQTADRDQLDSLARKKLGALLNAFGEAQWQAGRGVPCPSIEDAFEAVISAAVGLLAAQPVATDAYLKLADAMGYDSGKDGIEWSPEEWAAHLLAAYRVAPAAPFGYAAYWPNQVEKATLFPPKLGDSTWAAFRNAGQIVTPLYERPAPAAPAVDAPAKGEVVVEVHGLTGSGKSAICGEIEIMCRALGLEVAWPGGESEKRMTHAEWTAAIEAYKPRVRIVERNVPRQSNGGPAK